MNHGEEPLESATVSNACPNPACQYIREQYEGIEKKVEHELWRAAQAISRARAIRICASVVLYATALSYIICSDNMWVRVAGVVMVVTTFKAMHIEG